MRTIILIALLATLAGCMHQAPISPTDPVPIAEGWLECARACVPCAVCVIQNLPLEEWLAQLPVTVTPAAGPSLEAP